VDLLRKLSHVSLELHSQVLFGFWGVGFLDLLLSLLLFRFVEEQPKTKKQKT